MCCAMLREGGAPSADGAFVLHRRPHAGRRLAAMPGRWLRLRAARRVRRLSPSVPSDENELIILRVKARCGVLPCLARGRRQARRHHLVDGAPSPTAIQPQGAPVRRDQLDQPRMAAPRCSPTSSPRRSPSAPPGILSPREGGGLELSVINPAGVFGPAFWGRIFPARSTSSGRCSMAAMPAVPKIYFGLVDVRDVADLHLRAMTSRRRRKASGSSRSPASRCRSSRSQECSGARARAASAARVPRLQSA